jgi:hypothetical protein
VCSSDLFPPAYRALRDVLPVLVSIYVLVFCGCLWMQRPTALTRRIRASLFTGARIRWLILSFWTVLAANDLVKLPLYLGFDITGHTEYVAYVAEHHRIPLATEGWSMFQAPLFYVLSGMLVGAFKSMMSPEAVGRIVRLIPLACGLAQIEIAYRVLRRLWPERDDLQAAGTLVCAFIPMNLYMSQYAGNEPLAACFVALLLLLGLRYVQDGERRRSVRALLVMGFVLGLALLTKFTAVLMIAPLAILIFATGCAPRSFRRPGLAEGGGATGGGAAIYALVSMAKTFAIVLGVAVLVCGWYYLRNWIELGRPFFGGWESSRGIDWWQDPGNRTWRQFCSFGEAMVYPVCSSVVSFWDGVYSSLWADSYMSSMITPAGIPPWNRSFLLGGVWLALIPSGVMLTGLGVILRRPVRAAKQGPLFLVCALGVYFAAMLYGFLTVPYYCVVKASYTLGLLPCYGALIASGVDILGRGRLGRATVYSGVATWAVVAYLAYFVI